MTPPVWYHIIASGFGMNYQVNKLFFKITLINSFRFRFSCVPRWICSSSDPPTFFFKNFYLGLSESAWTDIALFSLIFYIYFFFDFLKTFYYLFCQNTIYSSGTLKMTARGVDMNESASSCLKIFSFLLSSRGCSNDRRITSN